mgnify:CR=1 FL=1
MGLDNLSDADLEKIAAGDLNDLSDHALEVLAEEPPVQGQRLRELQGATATASVEPPAWLAESISTKPSPSCTTPSPVRTRPITT